MVYSIIQKSQLESVLRMDAEYFQPEYFIDFAEGNWKSIGDIVEKCQYGLSLDMNDRQKGYPMFKMNNINDTFLFNKKVRFVDISEKIFNEFKLKNDDVLFNRVNSEEFVGRTGIFKIDLPATFASYLIRLQTKKNGEILPDYLNIFLNSKFGLRQIKKNLRRAVNQANVNAEELKQMRIAVLPMEFQKNIERMSNDSWNSFGQSEKLYQQAEDLLLEDLGLKNFNKDKSLFSIVSFSEVEDAKRMDAEYFQPKYKVLLERIVEKSKILENFIEDHSTGYPYKSENYLENGIPLIRINNIKPGFIDLENTAYLSEKDFSISPKDTAKAGDIVLSMSGTIGMTAEIPENIPKCAVNQRILKFTSKNIKKDYLILLLNSVVGSYQLERIGTGGVQTNISYKDIKNIFIPLLSKDKQQKIADLVKQSREARKKAKELLEEAKRKVEEMIEKGEDGSA